MTGAQRIARLTDAGIAVHIDASPYSGFAGQLCHPGLFNVCVPPLDERQPGVAKYLTLDGLLTAMEQAADSER